MTLPDAIAFSIIIISFALYLALYLAVLRYCEMKEYIHRHSKDYQDKE